MANEQENIKGLPEKTLLKETVCGELETLKSDLQNGETDKLLSRILSEESGLTKTLHGCGIDLFVQPSVNPICTMERVQKYNFGRRNEVAVFRSLVDGSGATSFVGLNHLLSFYIPSEKTWLDLRSNFSAEFIDEVEKSLNLVFVEEIVHILQNDNRDEDKYFLSKTMRHKTVPPPGIARKSLVELDATLTMLELGFGPIMENTIWLATHEDEYGDTVNVAKWAKVNIDQNSDNYLTVHNLPELAQNTG